MLRRVLLEDDVAEVLPGRFARSSDAPDLIPLSPTRDRSCGGTSPKSRYAIEKWRRPINRRKGAATRWRHSTTLGLR
jgi:hypothetical protein